MKKILLNIASGGLLIIILSFFVFFQPSVYAQMPQWDVPPAPDIDVVTALYRITDWLFAILLMVAAIFLIIAGYFFVTAQGEPDRITKAKQFILYALIGVLVGFLAKGLVGFVGTIVEG